LLVIILAIIAAILAIYLRSRKKKKPSWFINISSVQKTIYIFVSRISRFFLQFFDRIYL
jgi:hypothetical protein